MNGNNKSKSQKSSASFIRNPMFCGHCGIPGKDDETQLKLCSKCKVVSYCSPDCQRKHWKGGHKQACNTPQAQMTPINLPPVFPERLEYYSKNEENLSNENLKRNIKGKVNTASEECANCAAREGRDSTALLKCSKCSMVVYCSRACQVQHWGEGGHKRFCITPLQRSTLSNITPISDSEAALSEVSECVICGDGMDASEICILPCNHKFHKQCVSDVRKFGTSEVCPLCRAPLPPGPETMFDDALHTYLTVQRHVQQRGGSWCILSGSDEKAMNNAVALVLGAADQGHMRAQYLLAEMNAHGQGIPKNETEAVKWYYKAAEQGEAHGQFNFARMLFNGLGTAKNEVEAARWLQKSADQGNVDAQLSLGVMLASGLGIGKNETEAFKWFRKAAEQGSACAQQILGSMLGTGRGVKRNDAEAVMWFRKSAEQGLPEAQFILGGALKTGIGTPKNDAEAVKWYRKAADQGHAGAQYNLGVIFSVGEGIARNYAEAAKWHRKAAEQGNAEAQFTLGTRLVKGQGVLKNEIEAVKWFLKAAEQGYVKAQVGLGAALASGIGTMKNDVEAVKWFRAAADQGHQLAQCRLGMALVNGQGIAKNEVEAVIWLRKSAEQGDSDAQSILDRILQKQLLVCSPGKR